MDLLIKHAAETDGIQSYAPLLWPLVWSNMERTAGVAIRMTIKAGHAQAGLSRLSIASRVKFLLWEWRHQQAQAIELHGCQNVHEQAVIVVDRDYFAAGDVAQLGSALQIHRWRKLWQKCLGQIELDVVPLQPRKHSGLHLGEDLTAQAAALGGVRECLVGEDVPHANLVRA